MRNSLEQNPDFSRRSILILLHTGFLLVGIITVLLGQILPILFQKLSISDAEAGYFFIAQFTGSLAGVFAYDRSIKKFGYLKTLLFSFCLMASGAVLLNWGAYEATVAAILIYGTGIGSAIPTINMLIVEIDPARSSARLNFINFFWGIGAICSKPFVDFLGTSESFFVPTLLLAALFIINGFLIGFAKFEEPAEIIETDETGASKSAAKPIWKTPTAWLIAVFNFINIGIESSVGGWITTFENRLPEASPFLWLSAAFVFFLMMVAGRGLAPVFLKFLTDNGLLFANLTLLIGGAVLVLDAESFARLLLGAGLLGLGTSTIFPTNMSRFTKIFGAEAARRAAPVFIFGSLGGAFMTWLVGFVSTVFGSLRAGFFAILVGCLLLLVLQFAIARKNPVSG